MECWKLGWARHRDSRTDGSRRSRLVGGKCGGSPKSISYANHSLTRGTEPARSVELTTGTYKARPRVCLGFFLSFIHSLTHSASKQAPRRPWCPTQKVARDSATCRSRSLQNSFVSRRQLSKFVRLPYAAAQFRAIPQGYA